MRTTVTLDPDTAALVLKRMRERGVSFKQALNDAIRDGFEPPDGSGAGAYETDSADLGLPSVNLDRALGLLGELEDEELVRRMRAGK